MFVRWVRVKFEFDAIFAGPVVCVEIDNVGVDQLQIVESMFLRLLEQRSGMPGAPMHFDAQFARDVEDLEGVEVGYSVWIGSVFRGGHTHIPGQVLRRAEALGRLNVACDVVKVQTGGV